MMKTAFAAAILALCAAPMLLVAQTKTEQELTRAAIEANRKVLVSANMDLTEEEEAGFWPLYDDYQKDLDVLNKRTADLIVDYADNYYSLTDEKAKELLDEFLDIAEDRVKLQKTYVKKFRKKLPQRTVARYFQIENKFEAIVRFELARAIPLNR
jgi:hypothetical protein